MTDPNPGRRRFLAFLLKLSLVVPAGVLLAAPVENAKQKISIRALKPYLDTLLPEDDMPSATQVETDKALIEQARTNRRFGRLMVLGCAWLDQEAVALGAEEFAVLGETDREAIVTRAEASSAKSLPRQFFLHIRKEAFSHYYSQAVIWQGLGYRGPPQPLGFPGHAQPFKGAGA